MSDRIDEIESRLSELGRAATPDPPETPETPEVSREDEAPELPQDGEAPALRPPEPELESAAEPAAETTAEHAEGELRIPEGYGTLAGGADGRRAVGVVVSRYNGEITGRLLDRALAELEEVGVAREAI